MATSTAESQGLEVKTGGITSRQTPSLADRRKSTAVIDEVRVAIVEGGELSDADRRLAEMGYVQVYKREFSWMSCISFAFSVSSLYASVTTSFIYPLQAGGASSAVWSWLISGFGCYCIALSVAELVSAYPTSGGIYYTCKYLVPEKWVPEISWLVGWLNLIGQIAGVASTEYGCAQLLLAVVSMADDFHGYTPTDGQTVGVMAAITVFHGCLNSLSTSALEKMTKTYVVLHLAVLVASCITLLVMCDNKHSSSYVWTEIVNSSGWKPDGWSWQFGFLSASWCMTDSDATAHIAEEIKNPEIKAAWSIAGALGFAYVGGWLYNIVLAYCVGDISEKLKSPVAQPVAQIFYDVIGRGGGIFFTFMAFVVLSFGAMVGIHSGSRTVWAYARDELLPGSRIWYKIDGWSGTPVYSVWLFITCSILINLIALGSYTAIAAIFNLTAIALDWSYAIPILCKLLYGKFKPGPFHLGRMSPFINWWAVVWTGFVTIIYVQPTVRPVTKENMNYVSVIMVAVAIFAIVYWYAAGRFYYVGPRINARLIVNVEGEDKKPSPGSSSDGKKPGGLEAHKRPSVMSGQERATKLDGQSKV